jgi:hypothetical protein
MIKPLNSPAPSERQWLTNLVRTWRDLQNSSLISEHKRMFEKTLIEGQYGKLNG